jgi:hypothetical protein
MRGSTSFIQKTTFLLVLALTANFIGLCKGLDEQKALDPSLNDILISTVNKAAGKEIIPQDTVFGVRLEKKSFQSQKIIVIISAFFFLKLKDIVGTSTSTSVSFPQGGSAILSQSSYTKSSADAFRLSYAHAWKFALIVLMSIGLHHGFCE